LFVFLRQKKGERISMAQTINGVVRVTPIVDAAPIPSTTQLVQAYANVVQPKSGQPDLFALLSDHFWWFAPQNQVEAQPYLQGARIASAYGLQAQIGLYANVLFHIVTRDRAEWTEALVRRQLNYGGPTYCYPEELALPTQPFSVPVPGQSPFEHYEWVYSPADQFDALIPPRALQAMVLVEEYGAPAQSYWVADKIKVQPAWRMSVDPLLFAQYGRFFVSLAEWI